MGICQACCNSRGNSAGCIPNVTRQQCVDYDEEKKDGYDWTFHEGVDICPPPLPEE